VFEPGGVWRNRHLQSLMTSSPLRRLVVRRRAREFQDRSHDRIVDAGEGVRLLAHCTPARGQPRGSVVLLHGWEGSGDSSYLLAVGNVLWRRGFEIMRLNFRDHGDSHHLNAGLFHSCRLREVVGGVAALAADASPPVHLAGFSLGGNFALRVALAAPEHGIELAHVHAISPVISPAHVLLALERAPRVYSKYFETKWGHSLRRKQALFPERYDFSGWRRLSGLRAMTRDLVERYTGFESLDEYLAGYCIGGDYLAGLRVPATIITAADDPVIPVEDFAGLPDNPCLDLEIYPHGGHCGFLTGWGLHSWLEQELADRMVEQLSSARPSV